ncbi:MAG: hypothetical protein DYH20_02355 [Gammaproteobacteria bacterium PRO9]|nr:hypothetical protein [Gammaproteobacteria bacterium PRO9]
MSNQAPPPPPPARGKAPPPAQQGQGQGQGQGQSQGRAKTAPPARKPKPAQLHAPADANQDMGVKLDEAVVTAGRNGEQNLRITWIDVQLSSNWSSCMFDVASLPGHRLEAEAQQLTYRKSYAGSGQFRTEVTPVAAHGTRGKLIVRDLDTGEVLEQPWTWREWGGGGGGLFGWLLGLIKKLFAKPPG